MIDSAASLMLLDEELTESMRHAAPQQSRGGHRHRDGTAVVDELMTFEAPLPPDFARLLDWLRQKSGANS